MILTLRSRLTLMYAGVFGVLLIAIAATSYRVLAYQLDADVSADLAELTRALHGYLQFGNGAPTVVFEPTDLAETAFVNEATRYYQVFDATSGDLVVQSDALRPLGLAFTPAEVRQFRDQPSTFDVQTGYGRIRLSNSVIEPGLGRKYLLQVGVSLEPMDSVLNRYLVLLVLSVPAGLIAAIVVGRWTARTALSPLTHLAEATRTIDVEGLRRRLPVRDVALAFNQTLVRLEHAVGEMRQFSSAMAHELRTPLAALRGDIELAMLEPGADEEVRRRLAGQLEEIDRLKGLIDRILLLARAEAPGASSIIRRGPYRFIRHPMYSAALLCIWAAVLSHLSLGTLTLAVVVTLVVSFRLTAEERPLRTRYPEYSEYARSTKALVPFVV